MKKFFLLILFVSMPVFAQVETIFGNEEITNGGFGGPVVKFTNINGHFAVLVGGRGGWIINNTLVLGGGGYGLANEVEGTESSFSKKLNLNFGYGGFEMEYIIHSNRVIHGSLGCLIGGGTVNHKDHNDMDDWDIDWKNQDEFFIAEPFAGVELNILKFFRINAGASYRFISGVNRTLNLDNSDLSGFSAQITFKFGSF